MLLNLDDSGFARSLENSRKKLDGWGSSLRGLGTKMTAGITAPLVGSGVAFVKWAADLEQSVGATEHLWGSNADAILAWSKTADQSLGMTQDQALTTANRLYGIYSGMGLSTDQVMAKTEEMTQRFADLSALMGGSPTEAAEAYTSALMGNYTALDKYNININAAMVEQRALTMTGKESTAQLSAEEKQLAFNALYLEKTADAQGQFGREADTTTGKLTRLNARLKNIASAFGTLLLPYVNKAADVLAKLVKRIEGLSDTQRKWVLGIAAVAAALGPVLIVIGMMLPAIGALIGVIGFLISPIGLVVVAVALLVAGLIYAYTHFEGFRNVVDAVASTIRDGAIAAFEKLVEVFSKLKDAFDSGGFSQLFTTLGQMLLNGFIQLHVLAFEGVQALAQAFWNAAPGLLSAGWALIQSLASGAVGKWNEFTGWLGGLAANAATWITDTTSALWQKGVDLIVGLGEGAVIQWGNLVTWLGQRGPQAVVAIGVLSQTLWQKGVDLLVGLGDGAQVQWGNLRTWIGNRGTQAIAAIGGLTTTLWQKGVDLIVGLGEGAVAQWSNLKAWIGNLYSYAADAAVGMSVALWGAGWDLMSGLANGIYAGAESLVNAAISSVANLIPDWIKGPLGINSPSRVFMEIGHNTMLGLANGINRSAALPLNSVKGVARGVAGIDFNASTALAGYTPSIDGGLNSGHAGTGTTVVHNHINVVTPEQFLKMVKGGEFAENFAGELGMMEGVS